MDLERRVLSAFRGSLRGKKVWLGYIALLLCCAVLTFFRAAAQGAALWLSLHFHFLSLFVVSGILLVAGTALIRIYAEEKKGQRVRLKEALFSSAPQLGRAALLASFPLLASLCLWMTLGLFFLIEAIPVLGAILSVVASAVPFLLFSSTFLLGLASALFLFFAPPWIAAESSAPWSQIASMFSPFRTKPLLSSALFLLAAAPLSLFFFLFYQALRLTESSFALGGEEPLLLILQGLFLSPIFAALLTPFLLFFFHFSFESYQALRKSSSFFEAGV